MVRDRDAGHTGWIILSPSSLCRLYRSSKTMDERPYYGCRSRPDRRKPSDRRALQGSQDREMRLRLRAREKMRSPQRPFHSTNACNWPPDAPHRQVPSITNHAAPFSSQNSVVWPGELTLAPTTMQRHEDGNAGPGSVISSSPAPSPSVSLGLICKIVRSIR